MNQNMKTLENPAKDQWLSLCKRPTQNLESIEKQVQPILEDIRSNGDLALAKYVNLFDKLDFDNCQLSEIEINNAENLLSDELKSAIKQAYQNIYHFHEAQQSQIQKIETMPGVTCWRKSVGIQKVGLYIPGGTAPLFSTVLMLGIPAKIAGCQEVMICSPSNHPAILFAAKLVGVTKFFRIGGAQAIAAMAFGTETVPKVYKIFGPGNQYVTAAKMLVNKEGIAIDMPAGPSEVAVLADRSCVPAFVASDLLSQAEHGADSQVVLVTTDFEAIDKIKAELAIQIESLPRKEIAKAALQNSCCIYFEENGDAFDFLNLYAAEHLILAVENPEEIADKIVNAGSIFLGNYTPESAGDYASGTNHTLPTNGFATAYSGVSLDSFVKKITIQSISKEGISNLGQTVITMAEAESLQAHANAVKIRLSSL